MAYQTTFEQSVTMQIVFLDSDTIPNPLPVPTWATQWINCPATAPGAEAAIRALGTAQICITNKVKITAEVLAGAPNLKFVCVSATGYDCVDLHACRTHGVVVSNVPGYSRQSVGEGVIAFIFALRRALPYYQTEARQQWPASSHFCVHGAPVLNIKGATLGVFGKGAIGTEVATLAQALGMKVLFGEHRGAQVVRPGYVAFEQLLAQSDIITLHCPLTADTRGLIGTKELAQMKPGAMLINTARGPLIDETAVGDALLSGHLGGVALDVLASEPPAAEHPLLQMHLPNLIITPHITWANEDGMSRLTQGILGNLNAFVQGKPINVVS
jgi:glycerate dehydrogenase